MKKIGLFFLLSASYAGVLTFVFSTDFSRENSFLLPENQTALEAKAFEAPVMTDYEVISDRISQMEAYRPTIALETSGQSPESAN